MVGAVERLRQQRTLLFAVITLCLLAPRPAWAHVKYFEDASRYPLRTDLIFGSRTALWIGVSVTGLLALYLAQRWLGTSRWPEVGFLRRMAIGAPTLLAVQAAIGLVHAAVQPTLFAPNLPLRLDAVGLTLAAVQLLIAFSFITGLADWLAALALIALGPLGFFLFSPFDLVEQLYWAGIGLVVLVVGRYSVSESEARPWFQRHDAAWARRATTALRFITGLAIVAPALGEKLWNPDLGRAFLMDYPQFNVFHAYLGLGWLSDDMFVLVAGIVEATIGVLLMSGLLPRVVILGMWLPFNLGIPFLPPQELLGHLPIFGIMYFLLVYQAAPIEWKRLAGVPAGGPTTVPIVAQERNGAARARGGA